MSAWQERMQKVRVVSVGCMGMTGVLVIIFMLLTWTFEQYNQECVFDRDCYGVNSLCVQAKCECDVQYFHPPYQCIPNNPRPVVNVFFFITIGLILMCICECGCYAFVTDQSI